MSQTNKGAVTPPTKPQLGKRIETITRYIASLEHRLNTANTRIAERDAEIERISERLPCLCGVCPRLSRCENGAEKGGAV
jgi:hypothetical protein